MPDTPPNTPQHDDAGPGLGAQGAGRLPQTHQELTASLTGLVGLGSDYAAQNPQEASSGVWWWGVPSTEVHRHMQITETSREAAVLALFWVSEDGPHVLLTERSPELAKHPGQIAFPGGGAEESDADLPGTALREAHEETGLDPDRATVLGTLPVAPILASGFNVTPVIAVAEDPGPLAPQTGEVSRVLRTRVADLVEPAHRYTAVVVHRGPRLPSPAFLYGLTGDGGYSSINAQPHAEATEVASAFQETGAFVWGFTGTLLDRMLMRLGWAGEWDREREIDPRQFRRRR
ncbi:CoA pyrophosphatase [Nesterenkonia salmonea]|uniref:CoA pyrophosphatase n=1 Tax=Nesterenkonia salmonea TaxID=1804987 RepID=A0A5R9BL74_9MICC|nr:CoA pyrophosphatase [Nesterenkonia salmonea]TLQ01434.1 CoA pyrophosphatase [Nesterenkonia salmonea]